jgi:hypothetical protein
MRGARLKTICIACGGLLLLAACTEAANAETGSVETSPGNVRFVNVADEVGLDFQHGAFRWELSGDAAAMMGSGLCWLDYDRDGWLDLFVVNSYAEAEAGKWEANGGLPRTALFHNVAGRFANVSQASAADRPVRGSGCVAADFNLDGWTDVYITTARYDELLWNNGDGTFSEGAEAAGASVYGWHTGAVVGDLNADGWPDLFVAAYVDLNNRNPQAPTGFPSTHYGMRDVLYINQGLDASGHATFREVGEIVGLETKDFEYGLGALLTDLDDDGDLDLYLANDTNPNRLYENVPWRGGRDADPQDIGFRFEELGGAAQVNDNKSGMGVAGGDYNGDGRFDLFVTNMGWQMHSVYANQSSDDILLFRDVRDQSGNVELGGYWTGWGTAWADFDLDCDLDLVVVNGGVPVVNPAVDAEVVQVFGNLGAQGKAGELEDWTESAGLNVVGPLLGRGSAVADYDNDGDLDVAINSIGGGLVLLQNNGAIGNWLEVQLEGFQPGAVITAALPDAAELRREIHAGSSYLSSEDPRVHFGLGDAVTVPEIMVRWPDGAVTRLSNISANQLLTIER